MPDIPDLSTQIGMSSTDEATSRAACLNVAWMADRLNATPAGTWQVLQALGLEATAREIATARPRIVQPQPPEPATTELEPEPPALCRCPGEKHPLSTDSAGRRFCRVSANARKRELRRRARAERQAEREAS